MIFVESIFKLMYYIIEDSIYFVNIKL